MRASVVHAFGKPLSIDEIPIPMPGLQPNRRFLIGNLQWAYGTNVPLSGTKDFNKIFSQ